MPVKYPDAFLEIRFSDSSLPHPVTSLCAGYEGGKWRSAGFADHLFQWLPYVALSQENQLALNSTNFVELIKLAAAHIYSTKKTLTRGEIGEIMLHLSCILQFNTLPIMCKLVLKSSSNDTVKGFDGVHVLPSGSSFELWLGESKFYLDPEAAIREAVASIKDHILPSFLTMEKAMIIGHIADDIPHRSEVIKLFRTQTSSDELLKMAVFPVLIAYESKSVATHTSLIQSYTDSLSAEIKALRQYFAGRADAIPFRFELIFVPLHSKQELVAHFDKRLEVFL